MCNKAQYLWALERSSKSTLFFIAFVIFRWLPVLAFLLLLVYSWFTYVAVICFSLIQDSVQCIIYLFVYHILTVMALWCLVMVVSEYPARVPRSFRLSETMAKEIELLDESNQVQRQLKQQLLSNIVNQRRLDVKMCDNQGTISYCKMCRLIKPDRTHHCTRCGMCVVKFDHHCPWINSCVHFGNYKYFLLMLTYTTLHCIWLVLSSIYYFYVFFEQKLYTDRGSREAYNVPVIVVLTIAFMVYPLIPLFQYHIRLLRLNETTCEQQKSLKFSGIPTDNEINFSLGCKRNIKEVFGPDILLWPFPVWTTPGDGCHFKAMRGDSSWRISAARCQ